MFWDKRDAPKLGTTLFEEIYDAIDEAINKWYHNPEGHSLAHFLGMTDDEYRLFLEDENSLPSIVEKYKKENEK